MNPGHKDMKPPVTDQKRISYDRSPESADKKREVREVKPKYEMDERNLDCSICKNQLSPPVCQCKNNHLACQVCCNTRTNGQCPKCSQPIGCTRNKAIEEMLASLRMPCEQGCRSMLTTTTKKQLELYEYEFLLLSCPFPGCKFKSSFRKYFSHVDTSSTTTHG